MAYTKDEFIEKGLSAQRESKYVEFKRKFDPGSKKDWCGLIKEIVALTNTKGGVVIVGVDNTGNPVGENLSDALQVSPEEVTDKIRRYTGVEFGDFELSQCQKGGEDLLGIAVGRSEIPLVFEKPGTYPVGGGEQDSAFAQGTVYFRHGGKSEPGVRADLRDAIERRLDTVRDKWLGDIRKVVEADPGDAVVTVPEEAMDKEGEATPIRISEDPDAPVLQLRSPDRTYPYRQTEVIDKVNELLPNGKDINQYDIQAVRAAHDVDNNTNFVYQPKFGSQQYSRRFVEWVVEQYQANEDFFEDARDDYYEIR